MPKINDTFFESKEIIGILREIDSKPELTQRKLSSDLGISLGKVNFLLRTLIDKGIVKVSHFRKSDNRVACLYDLTSEGVQAKRQITSRYLEKKMQEYKELGKEIKQLKKEVNAAISSKNHS